MASVDPSEKELEKLLGEYVDRLNRGEKLDLQSIRSEHPELAEVLIKEIEAFQEIGPEVLASRPPTTLGDYRIIREAGRGGMGVVYEAWQRSMDRRVALKVLPAGLLADSRAVARFRREAKLAGRLHHSNVVSVYGMGVEDGTPCFAMEFVDGETLEQVLRRSAPNTDLKSCLRMAESFAGAADGLQHAHGQGIIHRDLKPSNLILDGNERLRILDFGLARLEGQETLTGSAEFLGTPRYMSPEQARPRNASVDHRTDIYSLGASLFEMLTWRPPFEGKDYQDTIHQILNRDPPPLHRLNPRIPRDLETVVSKCLRKEPPERYHTAEALAQDLRRFVRGDPIEARPQPGWEKLARRAWRYRGKIATGALVLGLVLTLGWVTLKNSRQESLRRIAEYEPKVEPRSPYGHHALGKLLEQKGELFEAFACYTKAVEIAPEAVARQAGASAIRLLRRKEKPKLPVKELVRVLEEALACNPENPAFLLRNLALARIYEPRGHDALRALECARLAVEKTGRRDPEALGALAEVHFARGEGAEAVRTMEEAVRLPDANRHLLAGLEDYRRSLLPRLVSYASIDAALATPEVETLHPRG